MVDRVECKVCHLTANELADNGNPVCTSGLPHLFVESENDEADLVNSPSHYTSHPSGIECVDVAEEFGFNLGNAIKYLWRADLKEDAIQDLEKAIWYIRREIDRRNRQANGRKITGV